MPKDYWAELQANQCYHIYNRAIGYDNLFASPRNYIFFIERWKKYIDPFFSTYAFCLMPNHFHFLAKAKGMSSETRELIKGLQNNKSKAFLQGDISSNDFYSSLFKAMFNSYSRAFNKEQNRTGSLFQAKFKRIVVRDEAHFIYLLKYIHNNPIHHGFCTDMDAWAFSSYALYVNRQDTWLAQKPVLKIFGSLEAFIQAHQDFRI